MEEWNEIFCQILSWSSLDSLRSPYDDIWEHTGWVAACMFAEIKAPVSRSIMCLCLGKIWLLQSLHISPKRDLAPCVLMMVPGHGFFKSCRWNGDPISSQVPLCGTASYGSQPIKDKADSCLSDILTFYVWGVADIFEKYFSPFIFFFSMVQWHLRIQLSQLNILNWFFKELHEVLA